MFPVHGAIGIQFDQRTGDHSFHRQQNNGWVLRYKSEDAGVVPIKAYPRRFASIDGDAYRRRRRVRSIQGEKLCVAAAVQEGTIRLPEHTLAFLDLQAGDRLMAIRSSNIAFTMGAKGPLIEKGKQYPGQIEVF